jgi:hypothetical protein
MFLELNLALCATCIILNVIQLLFNLQNFLKHRAYLEKFSILLQGVLISGLAVILLNLIIPNIHILQIIFIMETVAFGVALYGIFRMLELSGERRSRGEKVAVALYGTVGFIVTFILYSINVQVQVIEGHIYFSLDFWMVIIGTIILAAPVLYLGVLFTQRFLKIYEEQLRKPMIFFLFTLGFYLSSIFYIIVFVEVYGYIALIGSLIAGIALILKYPNLLSQLGSTFAFKRLYIVRNNGQTLFSHEFGPGDTEFKNKQLMQYLVGGFIYAITHGIKEFVEEPDSQLRTMDFGKMKMVFHYGDRVLGVLFSKEANSIIHKKLKDCIEEFELVFQQFLEESTAVNLLDGDMLNAQDKETLTKMQRLLEKHFKL